MNWKPSVPWLAILTLPILYAAAYYDNITRVYWGHTSGYGVVESPFPSYRIGGDAAHVLFGPVQQVDEKFRREYWASRDRTTP